MSTAPKPKLEKGPSELLEAELDEISKCLSRIYAWLGRIRHMNEDPGERKHSFIPAATRQVLGRQYDAERREQREALAAGLPAGRGASRLPGDLSAVSLEAEVDQTLRMLTRFVIARIPAGSTSTGAGTEGAVSQLRTVAMRIDQLWVATAVLRDLQHLVDRCQRALFGENRREVRAPCPHCGRRTLVIYIETGIIRCERPKDTDGRTRLPCECDTTITVSAKAGASRLCPCHSDPRRFEHQWFRSPAEADEANGVTAVRSGTHPLTWGVLAGALKQPLIPGVS